MCDFEQLSNLFLNANLSKLVYNYYYRDFPIGWSMEKSHNHEAIEIICCLEGNMHLLLENYDTEVVISKNDCLIINQGVMHFNKSNDKITSRCICLQLNKNVFNLKLLNKYGSNLKYNFFDDNTYSNGYIKLHDSKQISNCIMQIVTELNSKINGYTTLVKSLIVTLIIHITRNLEQMYSFQNTGRNFYIDSSIDYIKQNLSYPIKPQDIANYVHVSTNHLMHIFKQALSKTIMDIVLELRIERAKELLKYTTLSITEISDQCGYKNLQHFSMAFKKYMNTSPTLFRNQSREADLLRIDRNKKPASNIYHLKNTKIKDVS